MGIEPVILTEGTGTTIVVTGGNGGGGRITVAEPPVVVEIEIVLGTWVVTDAHEQPPGEQVVPMVVATLAVTVAPTTNVRPKRVAVTCGSNVLKGARSTMGLCKPQILPTQAGSCRSLSWLGSAMVTTAMASDTMREIFFIVK